MTYRADYAAVEPLRSAVDAMPGRVAMPAPGRAWLDDAGEVHLKVEDGKGRPLGRSFGVTLWPTVIVLEDGHERARVVRPTRAADLDALREALGA